MISCENQFPPPGKSGLAFSGSCGTGPRAGDGPAAGAGERAVRPPSLARMRATETPLLKTASRSDKALDRTGQKKQIGAAVGGKFRHDLFRRDLLPFVFKPCIPGVFGMRSPRGLDLEPGLDRIGDIAAGAGFLVPFRMTMIIRSL